MVQPKLGSGKRFSRLTKQLAVEHGINNPAALAASIGRKKYGPGKMSRMTAQGKKVY